MWVGALKGVVETSWPAETTLKDRERASSRLDPTVTGWRWTMSEWYCSCAQSNGRGCLPGHIQGRRQDVVSDWSRGRHSVGHLETGVYLLKTPLVLQQ